MSNLTLTAQWHDTINQVETSEPIIGGAEGNANLAPKQLAESLLWLKQQFETKKTESYKVGDIYMTTINHADAAAVKAHHGYGTWTRYAEGRAPVGFSDNTSDIAEYKTMGNTFGENTHKLTVDEMPSHKHSKNNVYDLFTAQAAEAIAAGYTAAGDGTTPSGFDNSGIGTELQVGDFTAAGIEAAKEKAIGGNQPHNNIQPSIVTGYWLRTA